MGDVERVMERVRRLLAIANDPAASDNEQRIALEQAQRLMDRHAIEEWQLEEDHDDVEIIERRIRLETNPCNRYMAQLANIVAHGNRCRAAYECRRAGNGRDVVSTVWIYGARVDVDKTESIWTAMETSRAAMWRERARTTPRAKANAAWRNGYYRGFQEEIARRYEILRREMESDGTGRELNPQKRHHRVTDLIADYHIGDTEEHRALADAIQEQMIYQALCREATTRGKWIER